MAQSRAVPQHAAKEGHQSILVHREWLLWADALLGCALGSAVILQEGKHCDQLSHWPTKVHANKTRINKTLRAGKEKNTGVFLHVCVIYLSSQSSREEGKAECPWSCNHTYLTVLKPFPACRSWIIKHSFSHPFFPWYSWHAAAESLLLPRQWASLPLQRSWKHMNPHNTCPSPDDKNVTLQWTLSKDL